MRSGAAKRDLLGSDGSRDVKAVSDWMTAYAASLQGVLGSAATTKAFWMKYGTPCVNGKPFILSESLWKDQKLRGVPDRVAGDWTLLNLFMR